MKQEKYFSLRNSIFDYKLTGNEFLVYSYLTKCCNRKTGIAWPSVPTIAKACGIGETTIRLATKSLEKTGLIEIKKTYEKNKSNRQTSNRYFLKPLHAGYGGVPISFSCPPPTDSDGEIYKQETKGTIINEQQSTNNEDDDFQTEEFYELLDNCYFHPERDKYYPSNTIKKMKTLKIDLEEGVQGRSDLDMKRFVSLILVTTMFIASISVYADTAEHLKFLCRNGWKQ